MTGAGAPRAGFGLRFRGGHSSFHAVARGVTDPGIGCTDWLGNLLSKMEYCFEIAGNTIKLGISLFRRVEYYIQYLVLFHFEIQTPVGRRSVEDKSLTSRTEALPAVRARKRNGIVD